ncbi:MAG: hypothetical protein EOO76_01125 [Novosphingobium sp.]|nr:MAG: hypothetical protein EOO76_01125 [Novosphingobium sp.]
MSNPSTFKAEPNGATGPDWGDHASLHRSNDGGGLLSDLKAVRHGSLADLIRFVVNLPNDEQDHYVIEKAGDHRLSIGEIRSLSRRADFPRA